MLASLRSQPSAVQDGQVLDHRLPRDGDSLGERRRGGLALCSKQIKQLAPGRIGQRDEDAVDRLDGGATFVRHTDGCSARVLSASSSCGQPPVLSFTARRRSSSDPASAANPLSTTRSRVLSPSGVNVNSTRVLLSSRRSSPGNALAQRYARYVGGSTFSTRTGKSPCSAFFATSDS